METDEFIQDTKTNLTETIDWTRHVEMQKTSGLNRLAYCRKNALRYECFNYWYKKLTHKKQNFFAVNVVPSVVNDFEKREAGKLRFPNGCELSIPTKEILSLILEKLV